MDNERYSRLLRENPDLIHAEHPYAFDMPELQTYFATHELTWTPEFFRACQVTGYYILDPPIEQVVLQYLKLYGDDVKCQLAIELNLVPPTIQSWGAYTDDQRYKHGILWGLSNPRLLGFARDGHLAVVQYLIEKQGADVHADNDLALQGASLYGHLVVVQYLIEHGADVHAEDDIALRWASRYGHLPVVQYLVEHGADVHAKDDEALRVASTNGHLHVVQYLQEYATHKASIEVLRIRLFQVQTRLPVGVGIFYPLMKREIC